jgi:hypothetical protein
MPGQWLQFRFSTNVEVVGNGLSPVAHISLVANQNQAGGSARDTGSQSVFDVTDKLASCGQGIAWASQKKGLGCNKNCLSRSGKLRCIESDSESVVKCTVPNIT